MRLKCKHIIYIAFVLNTVFSFAQETLNANDPNTFIFGGDQNSNLASVEILPFAIVDIETDPSNGISFGVTAADLEAGLPVSGGGGASGVNEDLWLNFSFRANNYQPARIYVLTNQPIPAGMSIKVQIINTGTGGDYPKNPNSNEITLNTSEQVIVYDFGSGYTGDGLNNGYQLRYTIDNTDGASLPPGFEVIYRIR